MLLHENAYTTRIRKKLRARRFVNGETSSHFSVCGRCARHASVIFSQPEICSVSNGRVFSSGIKPSSVSSAMPHKRNVVMVRGSDPNASFFRSESRSSEEAQETRSREEKSKIQHQETLRIFKCGGSS